MDILLRCASQNSSYLRRYIPMKLFISLTLFLLSAYSGVIFSAENYTTVHLDSFKIEYQTSQFITTTSEKNHFSAGIPYINMPASFVLDAEVFLSYQEFKNNDEFIAFYKDIHAQRTSSDTRHEIITFEITNQNIGTMICAKYSMLMKDLQAMNSSLNMIKAEGIGCLHPKIKNKIIEASYSVRNSDGNVTPYYQDIGARFLKSVSHE